MKLKSWQKNILSILTIVVVGFLLFNVAFIFAYLVNIIYRMVFLRFLGMYFEIREISLSWHYIYLILILLISYFILRSKRGDLFKATYMSMPLIVVLVEVGINFYRWPALIWVIGTGIVGIVLFYLYKTKRSWLYYVSTLYVVIIALFVILTGIDI